MWNLNTTQMSISMKHKHIHTYRKNRLNGCQEEGGQEKEGLGDWDQKVQTIMYRMDKQQGPTVQHRELYSISHNKL